MWQPTEEHQEPQRRAGSLVAECGSLLAQLLRCLLCCECPNPQGDGEGGQRLLGPHHEASVAIEAAGASPPRAPPPSAPSDVPAEAGRLLKGQSSRSASSSLNPAASPPMPLPFFSTTPPPPRHQRRGGGGGGSGGGSPAGGSPKGGGGMASSKDGKGGSHLSLLEDEDMCPTCLETYTEDNPKVLTRCGHHFHLPCLYAWLERSETCPVCSAPMHFDEII